MHNYRGWAGEREVGVGVKVGGKPKVGNTKHWNRKVAITLS